MIRWPVKPIMNNTLKSIAPGRRGNYTLVLIGVLLFVPLFYLPLSIVIADYRYALAYRVLDDNDTPVKDMVWLDAETYPDYLKSLAYLDDASSAVMKNPDYIRDLAMLYSRVGRWSEVLTTLGEPLPEGALDVETSLTLATRKMKLARALEPANGDHSFLMASLYHGVVVSVPEIDKEIDNALKAMPLNSELRSRVAYYYLNNDRGGDALEQARILAKVDRVYLPPERIRGTPLEDVWHEDMKERAFFGSRLFVAFEIAWRVSGDAEVVAGIAPKNEYAKYCLDLFFDWRGI